MKSVNRILCLLLVLCLALPMCLISVSADETEPVCYDLFCDAFKDLTYDQRGRCSFNRNTELVSSQYAAGILNVMPYVLSSKSSPFVVQSDKETGGQFLFNGFMQQKVGVGDWVALKFRSPGTGFYSISFKYFFLNQNNAGLVNAYLLPGNTAEDKIDSALTEDSFIGFAEIMSDTQQKKEHTLRVSSGTELAANQEYLLVLRFAEDYHNPEDDRVDFMLTSLVFDTGREGAFNPIRGEVAFASPVKTSEFYCAVNGINPANGHDLMYLIFKGGDMLVYDIDDKKIIDKEYIYLIQQRDPIITPDGHLWVGGSSNNIIEYDPSNATMEKEDVVRHIFSWDLVGGFKHQAEGLAYGDDGLLYFGYYGWILSLNPKTGEFKNVSGTQLTSDPNKASDAQFPCSGGIVYYEGYLYFGIYGDLNKDQVHTGELVKFDPRTGKAVQFINVIDSFRGETYQARYGFSSLWVHDGILYGTFSGRPDRPVIVDVSGDEMVRLDSVPGLDSDLLNCFTAELNGKYYVGGYVDKKESNRCLYEYDPATKTFTSLNDIYFPSSLVCANQGLVTVEGDPGLPGTSIVTAKNNSATGDVDLYFYNIETRETVIWSSVTEGHGTGVSLNAITADPTGRYLYTGGYGCNKLAICDTVTGEVFVYNTIGHQVDSLVWYDGDIWSGNYYDGQIIRFDLEYNEATAVCTTFDAVFRNRRMLNGTAADGKIFFSGTPDNGRSGGLLAWYDIARDLVYIATGPNPEDVYYTQSAASFTVWRNAVTHEIETFDLDGDGLYDHDIIIDDKGDDDHNNDDVIQQVYGVFQNRLINNINYVDGYIYGSTTKTNGNNVFHEEGNAEIFVYDVNNMKLLATYDLTQAIDGLEDPETGTVHWIHSVAADPYEKGKFWGAVCDTLFSFTFDMDTLTFHVKEELSFSKGQAYTPIGGDKWGKSIVFDGDYLYASFAYEGSCMINTADPSEYYQISATPAERMIKNKDGNLYYISGLDNLYFDIKIWNLAKYSQPLVAKSMQKVIDALPETVTMENEEQVMAAYNMYMDLADVAKEQVNPEKLLTAVAALEGEQATKANALIDAIGTVTLDSLNAIQTARWYYESIPAAAQAKVTKLSVLETAEEAYIEVKAASEVPAEKPTEPTTPENNEGGSKNNNAVLYIVIGAVVLIAAAIAVVLILKKKKKTEE